MKGSPMSSRPARRPIGQAAVNAAAEHQLDHAGFSHGLIDRRRLLQVGTLGCLGLSLPRLFEAESAQAARSHGADSAGNVKSRIVLFCYGGGGALGTGGKRG